MKQYPWILFTGGLLALAFAPGACGGGGSGGTGGGAGGGSNTTTSTSSSSGNTTTSSSTSSSSSSSGTPIAACDAPADAPSKGSCYMPKQAPACPHPGVDGGTGPDGGAVDCAGLINMPSPCGTCILGACCEELQDCKANTACWACFNDQTGQDPGCSDTTALDLLAKIRTCGNGCCTDTCFDPGCNPVTNEGCDTAAGEACDYGQTGYTCYAPPNDAMLCDFCSNGSEPFCAGTTHCLENDTGDDAACARFCCDDGDCGSGKCDKTGGDGMIGLCIPK